MRAVSQGFAVCLLGLWAAGCGPERPAVLFAQAVELGIGSEILDAEVGVISQVDHTIWLSAHLTQAPSTFDPEQEVQEAVDRSPLEWPENGVALEPMERGGLPVFYDCRLVEEPGPWRIGMRVFSAEAPGGFELASWEIGVVDLRGECELPQL